LDYIRKESNKLEAAKQAMEWGYPRPIPDEEAEGATWARFGDGVLVWFLLGPTDQDMVVHCCARKDKRGRLGTPRQMLALEILAECMGATRLYSVTGLPGEEGKIPRKAMRRFLRMRGWVQTDFGNYKDLGE
jgi:hypothetical protein